MAGDMMMLVRGLAKLSQAVIETQASMMRNGGAQAFAQGMQMNAEQGMGVAMQKLQVRRTGATAWGRGGGKYKHKYKIL